MAERLGVFIYGHLARPLQAMIKPNWTIGSLWGHFRALKAEQCAGFAPIAPARQDPSVVSASAVYPPSKVLEYRPAWMILGLTSGKG